MSSIWSRLINLAGNITGTLGVANGGTGLTSGTSGGVLGFTGSTTLASSALLAANGVVVGGGAGATPTSITAGTNGQLLVGVTSGAPAFGSSVSAATTFSGGVVYGNGGTNLNWYEEGTFTAGVAATGTSGTITQVVSFGIFTRIGRRLFFTVHVTWSNWTGSPTGTIQISGLPYTIKNLGDNDPPFVCLLDNVELTSGCLWVVGQGNPNAGTFNMLQIKGVPGTSAANSIGLDPALNAGAVTRGIFVSGSYDI